MKFAALFLSVLIFASAALAATYSSAYIADGWLKITRTAVVSSPSECFGDGVSDVCANTGAIQPSGKQSGVYTDVTLRAENIGSVDRTGIELTESLATLPSGAKLTFSPYPSSFDGRTAVWAIGSLSAGSSANIKYSFSARTDPGDFERMLDVSVRAEPARAYLFAPSDVTIGERVTLTLRVGGQPASGAEILVGMPDGTSRIIRTDAGGKAYFTANNEGFYTYSASQYDITNLASTDAQADNSIIPLTASAAVGTGSSVLPSLGGILPILAAIFAIAVIALIVYNFLNSRKEEESYSAPTANQAYTDQNAPNYTQKFTFSEESKKEASINDATRSLVESRKKQMQPSSLPVEKEETEEAANDTREESIFRKNETTSDSSVEEELVGLEEQARKGGEQSREIDDIEKTIAELETIRTKLRQRREKYSQDSDSHGQETGADGADSFEEAPEKVSSDEPESAPEAEAPEEIEETQSDFETDEAVADALYSRRAKPKRKAIAKKKPAREKRAPAKAKSKPKAKKMKFAGKGARKR